MALIVTYPHQKGWEGVTIRKDSLIRSIQNFPFIVWEKGNVIGAGWLYRKQGKHNKMAEAFSQIRADFCPLKKIAIDVPDTFIQLIFF